MTMMMKPSPFRLPIGDDLRITLPRRRMVSADEAFDLARALLRQGARAIVLEQADARPSPRRRALRGK